MDVPDKEAIEELNNIKRDYGTDIESSDEQNSSDNVIPSVDSVAEKVIDTFTKSKEFAKLCSKYSKVNKSRFIKFRTWSGITIFMYEIIRGGYIWSLV
jgi:hypothetical protein